MLSPDYGSSISEINTGVSKLLFDYCPPPVTRDPTIPCQVVFLDKTLLLEPKGLNNQAYHGATRTDKVGAKFCPLLCLVPRSQYFAAVIRFWSRGLGRKGIAKRVHK